MAQIYDTLFRGLISLLVLFIITKIIGRKQVSQLTLFDYVIGISIGNIAAEMTINLESKEILGTIAVIEFGLIAYIVSFFTMKSFKLRKIFTGPPTTLIDKGEIIYENLKKVHFDINDLLQELRINGYFDINDVEYALMEANGEVSVLAKSMYQTVKLKDLNIKQSDEGLVANLIIDSTLMDNNLKNAHKTKKWLDKELKIKGYNNYDNILLATLDKNEKIVVYEKNYEKKDNVLN